MPVWQNLSSHRYYRDADILFIEVHGDFTLEDVQGMYAAFAPIAAEFGYILLAFDGTHSGTLTAPARKYIGERNRDYRAEGGTAVIGASFTIRTIIQLLRNAGRLFGMRAAPMFFCATREEAVSWLVAQRQRCQADRAAARAKKPS